MPVWFRKTGKSTVRFADVHCHILYGVDDGSRSREMSLSMLKQAASEGVEAMILTPHFFAGRSTLTKESIRERTEILTEQCAAEGIGIELFPGAELYYTEETDEALAQGAVPTLNGTNRLLVEFSTDVLDAGILNAVKRIAGLGYVPVVAHVERYGSVAFDPRKVEALRDQGAEIQVNVSTLAGRYGLSAKSAMERLLKERLVDYLGTDAHDDRVRKVEVSKTVGRLFKKFDADYIEEITYLNARSLMDA